MFKIIFADKITFFIQVFYTAWSYEKISDEEINFTA